MPTWKNAPAPRSAISTMLTPEEQMRVDAAGGDLFESRHRASVDDVLSDLRQCRARAVVVSTAFCRQAVDITRVARVVREFPQVPTVALLSQLDRGTVRAVLTLGQCGIRTLVDVREPTGWRELRHLLAREQTADLQEVAIGQVLGDLPGLSPGTRRYFETLFRIASRAGALGDIATALQVLPSTLMSRFFRAQLPPPRRALAYARLVFAARLFENPGLSIARVAAELDYSSSQSFGRHVRHTLSITAQQFRDRYDSRGMLQRLRDDIIAPHRQRWLAFDPLASGRGARRLRTPAPTAGTTPLPSLA